MINILWSTVCRVSVSPRFLRSLFVDPAAMEQDGAERED